jgi:hypothetical protein
MGNTIQLIKAYRDKTGVDLRVAVDAVHAYKNGNTTNKTLIEQLEKSLPPPPPAGQNERMYIRNKVENIDALIKELKDITVDEFGIDEISNIKEMADKVADEALFIKDRLCSRLEDSLEK